MGSVSRRVTDRGRSNDALVFQAHKVGIFGSSNTRMFFALK
jgi:hypothetical protein